MQQVDEKRELRHDSSSTSLRSGSSASECTRATVSSADTDTLSLKFGSSQRWADIDSDDEDIEAFVFQLQNGLVVEAEDSTFDDCDAAPETDGVPNRAASSQKVDQISLCSPSEVSPGTTTLACQTKVPDVVHPNLQRPQFCDDQCTNQMMSPAQIYWMMPEVPPPPSPCQGNLLEYPSAGSVGHPFTCNAPCRFNSGNRCCKDAAACTRCHLCTWSRAANRVRPHGIRTPSSVMYAHGWLNHPFSA